MKYDDPIYGSVEIDEPILLDLMNSTAMQRLHLVLQHGISALIGLTTPITRFQHSLGAMLIVRRLGGSVKEQIAAMLHDVSHTAFSHVIDHVVDNPHDQSYHDVKKAEYVAKTDLPAILAAHGYDWTDFLDEAAYPLLEQPSPHLCADRIDYCLRDGEGLGLATVDEIADFLPQMCLVDSLPQRSTRNSGDRIVLKTLQSAQWLADIYLKSDDKSWSNFYEVGIYELTARAIKTGLRVGAITEADFWGTDAKVWQKLHAFADDTLQKELGMVSPETEIVWDDENPDFIIRTKIRAIDPDVLGDDGVIRPLTNLDPIFARRRTDYLKRKQTEWHMRAISK